MKQPHSWMEYQYRFAGNNDNNKMWMRDTDRIYQMANSRYFVAIAEDWYNDTFDTFADAQQMIDNVKNDN